MALTDEFTAEIEAVTTEQADTLGEENKGEAADGGRAFVSEGDGTKREDTNDGDTVVSSEQSGERDSNTSPSGSTGEDGEGGGSKTDGAGYGNEPGDGGNKGTSPAAIMRAIEAGISAADAAALGDDKLVDQLVAQRQQAEVERLESEELEALRAEELAEAEKKQKELQESLPKLDPEETDPNVIAAFEAMQKLVTDQQAQLEALRAEQASQSTAADAAREQEVARWFEGKVTTLSESFDKVLGKDGVNAVTITPETADQIAGKVAIMVEGYRGSNLPVPELDTLFDEAARSVMSKDFARMDEAQLAERMDKRAAQDISRPGGSKSKTERSPTDEVADMIDKRYFADRS